MKLKEREDFHLGRSDTAYELCSDHGQPANALFRIEAALHDLGATIALAARSGPDTPEDQEEQDAAMRLLRDAVDQYQAAIEKAHRGLAPWGEILLVGEGLQQAIQRVFGLRR